MGLSRNHDLFTQKWQDGLKTVGESGMSATFTLFTVDDEVYVPPPVDEWTVEATTHYLGKARVQPIRAANERRIEGNSSSVQVILVSVPIDAVVGDLFVAQQGRVLVAPLNPDLTRHEYVVSEIIDSSNPFERTFYCTVNQETVVP